MILQTVRVYLRITINFEHIKQSNNPRMIQLFMDIVLSQRMSTKRNKKFFTFIMIHNILI